MQVRHSTLSEQSERVSAATMRIFNVTSTSAIESSKNGNIKEYGKNENKNGKCWKVKFLREELERKSANRQKQENGLCDQRNKRGNGRKTQRIQKQQFTEISVSVRVHVRFMNNSWIKSERPYKEVSEDFTAVEYVTYIRHGEED